MVAEKQVVGWSDERYKQIVSALSHSISVADKKVLKNIQKLEVKRIKLFENLIRFGDADSLRRFINDQGLSASLHLNPNGVWVEPNLMQWDATRTGGGSSIRAALIDFIRHNFTSKGRLK